MPSAYPSLLWLDALRAMARTGSVRCAAADLGLSPSAVSHQLRALEDHVGVPLLDHTCRPMRLTPQGRAYLTHAETALDALAMAQADVIRTAPESLTDLRFAMIEDFESDIGPEITRMLAEALPHCRLTHYTRPSRDILAMLKTRTLDLGIATQPLTPLPNIDETALVRDPFVLAVPAGAEAAAEDYLTGALPLPLLRYNPAQILGHLIDAQLSRMRLSPAGTSQFDSTSSILALVARGFGWAITTPTTFASAQRFQAQVTLLPFPKHTVARTISIFVDDPRAAPIAAAIADRLRALLLAEKIGPLVQRYPWLEDKLTVLNEDISAASQR